MKIKKNLFLNLFKNFLFTLVFKWQASRGYIAIDICSDYGIGSKMITAIYLLDFCSNAELTPEFSFSYPDDDKTDYFECFFLLQKGANHPKLKIRSVNEIGLSGKFDDAFSLSDASKLFEKYIGISDLIIDEVDSFASTSFKNKKILGIHCRGTDKIDEAEALDFHSILNSVFSILDSNQSIKTVFISTDETKYINLLTKELMPLGYEVLFREDSKRSIDGKAIHLKENDVNRKDIIKDALVNCLLLSKCDVLLKSVSILSDWSKIFNPELKIFMLNKPNEHANWFPTNKVYLGSEKISN